MRRTIAIARRELQERWQLLMVALLLSMAPFLAGLLPASRGNREVIVASLGGFIAIILASGVSLGLGGSAVGTDLTQRRLSFYFSRPIAASSIWFGKALAGLLLAAAVLVIVALPAFLANRGAWHRQWGSDPSGLLVIALFLIALFVVSHFVSSVVRSRSALAGVDFLFAIAGIVALILLVRPLLMGGSMRTAALLLEIVGAAILVILSVAPVWQLARGRADVKRSHAALFVAFWGAAAVVLLIAASFVVWFISPSPAALTKVWEVAQPPGGNWMLVLGNAKNRGDFVAGFLVQPSTGRYERVASSNWWNAQFSLRGDRLVWLAPTNPLVPAGEVELHTRELGREAGEVQATGHRFRYPLAISLSDDGTRAAVLSQGTLSVFELATTRLVASMKVPMRANSTTMLFTGPDTVRMLEKSAGAANSRQAALVISEFNTSSRTLRQLGRAAVPLRHMAIMASADASRLLPVGSDAMIDGRTAEELFRLPPAQRFGTALLNDGSAAVASDEAGVQVLRVVSPSGQVERIIPLPGVRRAFVSAETTDGRLIVSGSVGEARGGQFRDWRTIVIDRRRGVVERTSAGVRVPFLRWPADPRLPRYAPGEWIGATDPDGRMILWNPGTGAKKPLFS